MIFALFIVSPLPVCINCSFVKIYSGIKQLLKQHVCVNCMLMKLSVKNCITVNNNNLIKTYQANTHWHWWPAWAAVVQHLLAAIFDPPVANCRAMLKQNKSSNWFGKRWHRHHARSPWETKNPNVGGQQVGMLVDNVQENFNTVPPQKMCLPVGNLDPYPIQDYPETTSLQPNGILIGSAIFAQTTPVPVM